MSKNRDRALDRRAELHVEYCPMLDKLLDATDDTVEGPIAEEKHLGEQIWIWGERAFGKRAGARLHYMKPASKDELAEMGALGIERRALSQDHFWAMQACIWRGRRLGAYLEEAGDAPPRGKLKRLWETYSASCEEQPNVDDKILRVEARKAHSADAASLRKAISLYREA